jgi:hypothetical protein
MQNKQHAVIEFLAAEDVPLTAIHLWPSLQLSHSLTKAIIMTIMTPSLLVKH